ncbi:unnamed protein product [Cunninghamella blakesleeana]
MYFIYIILTFIYIHIYTYIYIFDFIHRNRRSYDPSGKSSCSSLEKKATKKRTTMNSQEASMSLEDILAARQALGFTHNNMNAFLSNKSTFNSTSPSNEENQDQSTVTATATTGKRKRDDRTNQSKNDDEDQHENTDNLVQNELNPTKDAIDYDKLKHSSSEPEGTEFEGKSNPTKIKRTASGKSKTTISDENHDSVEGKTTNKNNDKKGKHTSNNNISKKSSNGNGKKSNQNPRSRTTTPQPTESVTLQSNTALSVSSSSSTTTAMTTTNNNIPSSPSIATTSFESSLLERFSAESRATSPPAKVRYPNPRMSNNEMNRRAQQILDYISSIQVDMANKTNDIFQNVSDYTGSTIIVHQQQYKSNMVTTSTSTSPSSSSSSPSSSVLSSSPLENVQINEKTGLDQDSNITSAGTEKKTKTKQRPSSLVIPEQRYDDGPSSSLSSASTLPLENSNPGTPEMDLDDDNHDIAEKREETSFEMMDRLTREIIKFQQKFGTCNNSHHRRSHSQPDERF